MKIITCVNPDMILILQSAHTKPALCSYVCITFTKQSNIVPDIPS